MTVSVQREARRKAFISHLARAHHREITERSRATMNALHQKPEFRKRLLEGRKAFWTNPKTNPLVRLTKQERAEYDRLIRRYKYTRAEAFKIIGREDLVV